MRCPQKQPQPKYGPFYFFVHNDFYLHIMRSKKMYLNAVPIWSATGAKVRRFRDRLWIKYSFSFVKHRFKKWEESVSSMNVQTSYGNAIRNKKQKCSIKSG